MLCDVRGNSCCHDGSLLGRLSSESKKSNSFLAGNPEHRDSVLTQAE